MSRTQRNANTCMVTDLNGKLYTKEENVRKIQESWSGISNGAYYARKALSRNNKIKNVDKKHGKLVTADGIFPGYFHDIDFGDYVSTPGRKKAAKQHKHRIERRKKINLND